MSHGLVLRGAGAKKECDSTDLDGNLLTVDPTLTGEAFQLAKAAVYWRACAAWNARDRSTRERISQSQTSCGQPGSEGSEGSQPMGSSPPVEGG